MTAHPSTPRLFEQPHYSLGEFVSYQPDPKWLLNGTVVGMEITQVTGLLRYCIEDSHGNRAWIYADEMRGKINGSVRYLGIHNEGHDDDGE